MNHKSIEALLKPLEIVELTEDNFEEFSGYVDEIFDERGKEFKIYFRPGYNEDSKHVHRWKSGQPKWDEYDKLKFDTLEQGVMEVSVRFTNSAVETWSAEGMGKRPLLFAYDSDRGILYIGDQGLDGTPQYPLSMLYDKIE